MDNIDNIEKYLKGQLTAEEEKAFREQLKNDKAFRDEVLATALMIKQMKLQNQEKEEAILEEVGKAGAGMFVDDSHGDIGQTVVNYTIEGFPTASTPTASTPAASRRPWIYWASSIAAVLIIGFFAVKPIYFNYKSGQMISQNYAQWSPREEGATSRGEVQAGDNVVAELSELFDNVGKGKDMKMTIYRLEKALQESETDYDYYQYSDDIVWYLALAYIQNNQFGKARIELLKIIGSHESDYLKIEKAEKLYKEIENMYFM